MIKLLCRLLLPLGILVVTAPGPLAQGAQEPSLITIPSTPVANQPFRLKATFFGPTTPCLFNLAEYVGFGQVGLVLISCDITAPRQWVTQEVIVPGQHEGPYEVDFASPGFSPRPVYATFNITVAAAPPVAVPAVSNIGAALGAVFLCLAGVLGLRRRDLQVSRHGPRPFPRREQARGRPARVGRRREEKYVVLELKLTRRCPTGGNSRQENGVSWSRLVD